MKKSIIIILFTLLPFLASAQGFDIGLNVESTTSYLNDGDSFVQQGLKGSPYFFIKDSSWQLGIKGGFSAFFQNNFSTPGTKSFFWAELESLVFSTFSGSETGRFALSLGRIKFQDPTTEVINQTLDGFNLEFSQQTWTAGISAGYNGLQYKKTGQMALSIIDLAEMNGEQYLASPRAVGMAEFKLRDLGPASLGIAFLWQQDLRNLTNPDLVKKAGDVVPTGNVSGLYNSQYLAVDSNFRLSSSAFLNFYVVGMLSQGLYKVSGTPDKKFKDFLGTSLLTGVSASFFFDGDQNLKVSAQLSTGNSRPEDDLQEDSSHLFRPLTASTLGILFNPTAGNLILGSIQYSIKPFTGAGEPWDRFQLLLKETSFFRAVNGPISDVSAKTPSDRLYLGSELDLVANLKLASDFGLSLSNGLFLPDTSPGGAFEGSPSFKFKSNLFFSLSF